MKAPPKPRARKSAPSLPKWKLRLYVADNTPKSFAALRNLELLCEQYLAGRYQIEVISLLKNPGRARVDQILAVPAVVRTLPAPIRKIVGNLSDAERVLLGLDLTNRFPGQAAPLIGTKHV